MRKLKEFAEKYPWTFSKTYARTAPHEYVVRENVADDESFDEIVMLIREKGFKCNFWKAEHIYLELDGKYYWTMGSPLEETIIINRCESKDYVIFNIKDGKVGMKYAR